MPPKKKIISTSKNKTEENSKIAIKQKPPQLLKGMKDVLPADQRYWQVILKACRRIASSHMFEWIETPVLESTALYQRSTGKTSDIVKKEMFSFIDQGNENVTLRPEFTPGIARAYVEHGMLNLPQPVKLFSYGPLFRHDKPQAGRYRQFTQLNFEIFGDGAPAVDAELIAMQYFILHDVGLESIIHVNSIGCPDCRPQYKQLIVDYFKSKKKNLCEDCKERLTKNPLRILDCKEQVCKEIAAEAPQTVDYLCDDCKDHFMKVLEHLDDADIPYALDPKIVRGLDYYSKTTFEAFLVEKGEEKIGRQTALGAGGRYDGLVEMLGGRAETPGSGFAMGVERILLAMKENEVNPPSLPTPDIFLAQLGVSARKKAIRLLEDLREEGFFIRANLVKDSISSQLSVANKLGVKLTLILGQKEVIDKTILIRDMETGSQEIIDANKIVPEINKRLKKINNK